MAEDRRKYNGKNRKASLYVIKITYEDDSKLFSGYSVCSNGVEYSDELIYTDRLEDALWLRGKYNKVALSLQKVLKDVVKDHIRHNKPYKSIEIVETTFKSS
jgi:hypothetical protein